MDPSLNHASQDGSTIATMFVYLSKPVLREIKKIALEYDRKPHDILLEGVNLVLTRYGRPSISDLEGK